MDNTGPGSTLLRLARSLLAAAIIPVLAGCEQSLELGPGIRAPAAPVQSELLSPTAAPPIRHGEFTLTPRAEFTVTAKLLAKRRYRWDRMAPLAPWDFALGWGFMSDEAILQWVHLTQGDRFLFRKLLHSGLPLARIDEFSANVHLIPANAALLAQLDAAPRGAIVTLTGVLVDARDEDTGLSYTTSLERGDSGAGACEILLVQRVQIGGGLLAAAAPPRPALSAR